MDNLIMDLETPMDVALAIEKLAYIRDMGRMGDPQALLPIMTVSDIIQYYRNKIIECCKEALYKNMDYLSVRMNGMDIEKVLGPLQIKE